MSPVAQVTDSTFNLEVIDSVIPVLVTLPTLPKLPSVSELICFFGWLLYLAIALLKVDNL